MALLSNEPRSFRGNIQDTISTGTRPVYSRIQQKNFVSDVRLRRKSVKLRERGTRSLRQPRSTRTEGAPTLEHSGPRGAEYWSQKDEGSPRAGNQPTEARNCTGLAEVSLYSTHFTHESFQYTESGRQ